MKSSIHGYLRGMSELAKEKSARNKDILKNPNATRPLLSAADAARSATGGRVTCVARAASVCSSVDDDGDGARDRVDS